MSVTKKLEVRLASPADLVEVLRIERASFGFPWNEDDFISFMRLGRTMGIVAEQGGRILGYAMYGHRDGKIVIYNIAVLPDSRGKGVGYSMVAHLLTKVPSQQLVFAVPVIFEDAKSFCEHLRLRTSPRNTKWIVPAGITWSDMTIDDVVEAKRREQAFLSLGQPSSREIGDLFAQGKHQGVVVRDACTKDLLGYALYSDNAEGGISVDGIRGVVVMQKLRRHGIGTLLMLEIAKRGWPVTVTSISLHDHAGCSFLRVVGLPIPPPLKPVTVTWRPELPEQG